MEQREREREKTEEIDPEERKGGKRKEKASGENISI